MRIYSVSAANYNRLCNDVSPNCRHTSYRSPNVTAGMSAAAFKAQNKTVTLPSGMKYEIDEESIKDFPPEDKQEFYATIIELEPLLEKKKDDENFKFLRLVFAGEKIEGKSNPYRMKLHVECPDMKKFREVILSNKANYKQAIIDHWESLKVDAIQFAQIITITLQQIDETISRAYTRKDEDYKKIDEMKKAEIDCREGKDNFCGVFTLEGIEDALENSNPNCFYEAIFENYLKNQ